MQELEARVRHLEGALPPYGASLRFALDYIGSDAASSLTKSRTVMEKVLAAIYTAEMGHAPRKPLLGEILTENQFTRKIDRRILTRINAIRDMGNLGPHGEEVNASDAARVLEDLCTVLEWYLTHYPRERTENGTRPDEERFDPYPVPPVETAQEVSEDLLETALRGPLKAWKKVESELPEDRAKKRVELHREYKFEQFRDVIEFMSQVAPGCDIANHHPRWENIWKTLRVYLTTWNIGHRISDRDVQLAKYLDSAYADFRTRYRVGR
jgi:pterin-4a-carbinolamine dehydratase